MTQLPCFEVLKELASKDPEAFEAFRQQSCLDYIETIPTPHRNRLKAVQFRVDYEIRRAKTPMAGLVKVSGMMHDCFYRLNSKLNQFTNLVSEGESTPEVESKADVVSLSGWNRQRPSDSAAEHDPN